MHHRPMLRPIASGLLLVTCLASVQGVTQPERSHDPLLLLPPPPKPAWQVVAAPPTGEQVIVGTTALRKVQDQRVMMDAVLNMDKGPQDGLEVVACMKDGKCHESVMRVELSGTQGSFIKYACIAALGLDDGVSSAESSGMPARGTPVRLRVYWHDEDDGTWKVLDASCLVRDRDMDKAYPPLPFIYTGSRKVTVMEVGPSGKPEPREHFMLNNTRSIAVAYDEADALLASPFPGAREDARFEANSALAPPVGTKLVLDIEHADLPLTLMADEHGALSLKGDSLDDARLQALLGKTYGPGLPQDALRAVGVQVSRAMEREIDTSIRTHLLAAAAAAKVWVVPVFVVPAE